MTTRTKVGPFTMSEDDYRAVCDENGGFCLACREQAYGVEPDARKYTCESCDAPQVYGCEELLMMGLVEFTE